MNFQCGTRSDIQIFLNLQDVYVSRVAEGGPSALAGLKAGDRMISVYIYSIRLCIYYSIDYGISFLCSLFN